MSANRRRHMVLDPFLVLVLREAVAIDRILGPGVVPLAMDRLAAVQRSEVEAVHAGLEGGFFAVERRTPAVLRVG